MVKEDPKLDKSPFKYTWVLDKLKVDRVILIIAEFKALIPSRPYLLVLFSSQSCNSYHCW
ncbi:hypothetical protein RO3G_10255 [Rhizopus delemar RA 99-880]|uniref:Uncharacterized protein n=1 Tax=Rhizopus delemar (strain RA 99-880 / ATCC MYA-4621 / FGSC 9543 / NRRL 43880) TaxID=246409 RepID=I1CAR5_RHIO9|nr:hypothetical protein RO3G_10255 [Rhizopus delemar RA 99-880]|eukprot:EIE85545.1 hypothetical protein RO3G_10255 [Rhizopus delemar RA 99-880]